MKLFVTIDTEPDCDINWKRSNPLTFTSVTHGIPELLRPLWDKYHIQPIYFVSPEVILNEECCKTLRDEIEKQAIIGAHLHSEYIEPHVTIADPAGKSSGEFPCYAHSTVIELEKIQNLTDLIKAKLNYRPVWYRAARFGADLDTIKSLKQLGYTCESSITPGINWQKKGGPDHSKAPLQPYWISPNDYYQPTDKNTSIGIMEYPITIFGKRFGLLGKLLPDNWLCYNWLRPTHMTVWEQKKLIAKIKKQYRNPTFVIMFHSMEIMPKMTPYVKNKWMQKRFLTNLEKTIAYILET